MSGGASGPALSRGSFGRSVGIFSSSGGCDMANLSQISSSAIPDTRIDKPVGDVNQQVEDQDQGGDEGRDAEQERLVAIERGVDQVSSKPRQVEDLLDDDRPADDEGQRRACKAHDGEESAAQGVTEDDRSLAQALGPRRPDVILS